MPFRPLCVEEGRNKYKNKQKNLTCKRNVAALRQKCVAAGEGAVMLYISFNKRIPHSYGTLSDISKT